MTVSATSADVTPSTEPADNPQSVASRGTFPLTVVVLAKNEAANLPRCLDAVAWCDQVIVVDDHSTDGSAAIAGKHGAEVVVRAFDTFAGQRNAVLDDPIVRNDWVLMLDADEVVRPQLRAEIERTLPQAGGEVVGFKMCRRTMLLDRWLKRSDGFPVWIMRLVRRGGPRFADSGHGEVPVPTVEGELGTLREPFDHFAFSRGLTDWVQRHLRYADREAKKELRLQQRRDEAEAVRWSDLVAREKPTRRAAQRRLSRRVPGRPVLRFLYQYVAKGGFLDGSAGLIFCTLMAGYEGFIGLRKRELRREGWSDDADAAD